jgi:adenylate cyclase
MLGVIKKDGQAIVGGKKPRGVHLTQAGLSLALAVLVILFTQDFLFELSPLRRLELSTLDFRFSLRGPLPVPQESLKVVILEITEESFKSLPARWPWPAAYYARSVRNLQHAGAAAVGIDIVFSEPDKHGKESAEDFRNAIRETNICVLAGKLEVSSEHQTITRGDENYNNVYFDVDSSIGIVNVVRDADGVLRRYVPYWYHQGTERLIPTLAFACLNKVFSQSPFAVAEYTPDAFLYEGRVIPKVDNISMLINYYGPDGMFPRVKFSDVIDDHEFTTVEEAESGEPINTFDDPDFGYLLSGYFNGKVVLIGSTMPEDKDEFPVSLAKGGRAGHNLMYGVEIHANVIQNVLDRNFLKKQSKWSEVLSIVVLCSLAFFITAKIKELKFRKQAVGEVVGALAVVLGLFVVFFVSYLLFAHYNYVTAVTSPTLALIVGFVGATTYNYVTERKQKVLIKGMFSQYVNPTFVNELVAHPEKLRLGGERKELTVLFSDIAGFTTIAERMSPENLVALLNDYLSIMTDIVFATGGTLDKYEGDAIMAFWGAPIPQEDHALRACRAALEMQKAIIRIRERWEREGKPSISVRIGLSTGEMVVGNMGGSRKFDYTVIGDSVNLGSRLEGANKEYGTSIMMSQKTYERVKNLVIARELDLLVVKGKTEPIAVYELVGLANDAISAEYHDFLNHYNLGLQHYRNRRWREAIEHFQHALKIAPDDYPSQMYISRIRAYEESPPPPEWNGVFVLKTK